MTTWLASTDRRLGFRTIVSDYTSTWTTRSGRQGTQDRIAAASWNFGLPTLLAAPFVIWQKHAHNLGQLLSGVSLFTGLLFGLLVLMFNTGLALRKDPQTLASAHGLNELVSDIRATTTWAVMSSLALAGALVLAAASTPTTQDTPWGFTPVFVWLGAHLFLTLLSILRRFRTAFNYLTR